MGSVTLLLTARCLIACGITMCYVSLPKWPVCQDSGHFERDTQASKSGEIFYSYTPRRRSPLLEFYSYGCACTTGLHSARGFGGALKLVQPAAPAVPPAPQPPQPVQAAEGP